jgi:hypothetical protein
VESKRRRPANRREGRRSVLTDALYRRMIANPDRRIPFVLTERA